MTALLFAAVALVGAEEPALSSPPSSGTAEIAAGRDHTCAIRADATLACWGDDSQGQLDGVPAGAFDAVSAGGAHTCAIRSGDRSLACWGGDSQGQLDGVPAGAFDAVSAGGAHTCAIRSGDRSLACWGGEPGGELAGVHPGEYAAVSSGGAHTCALRLDRHLRCWGENGDGQAGPIPDGWWHWHWHWAHRHSHFSAVGAGGAHTCAIRTAGDSLACWGDDSKGQLDGVPAGAFGAVSAGGAHTCAIGLDESLACWGDDSSRQLEGVPAGAFEDVSAGGAHTCAAPIAGRPVCWGANGHGQSRPVFVDTQPAGATVGEPYAHRFETTAQAPRPEFRLLSGALPAGLLLTADGRLEGTPAAAGSYDFEVAAGNGVVADATQTVTLVVEEPEPPPPVAAAAAAPPPGLPPPVAGQSFNLDPVGGVVRTRCLGGGFSRLEKPEQVPLDCIVDARAGTVGVTASKGSGGETQTADFWGGRFRLRQDAGDNQNVELDLAGKRECERRRFKRHGRVLLRRRGKGRRLWGKGSGKYKTTGRHGAATVRGTTWLVADRCDGSTLFRVREGTVWVLDFFRRKQVVLRAGQTYIARPSFSRLR